MLGLRQVGFGVELGTGTDSWFGILVEFSRCKLKSDAKWGPIPVGSAPCAFRATARLQLLCIPGPTKDTFTSATKSPLISGGYVGFRRESGLPTVCWDLDNSLEASPGRRRNN